MHIRYVFYICRRDHVICVCLRPTHIVLCLFTYSYVPHILCCVCLRTVTSHTYCVVFVYVQLRPTHIVLCLFTYSYVPHILCCVCLRTVTSHTYCVVFVYVQLRPTHIVLCFSWSCGPYVAFFSGFSIFDCTFGIL